MSLMTPTSGVGEGLDDELDGDLVVRALVLELVVRLALGLVRYAGAAEGDALDDARGEDVLVIPIVDLIFDGAGAAIEGEDYHE